MTGESPEEGLETDGGPAPGRNNAKDVMAIYFRLGASTSLAAQQTLTLAFAVWKSRKQ